MAASVAFLSCLRQGLFRIQFSIGARWHSLAVAIWGLSIRLELSEQLRSNGRVPRDLVLAPGVDHAAEGARDLSLVVILEDSQYCFFLSKV